MKAALGFLCVLHSPILGAANARVEFAFGVLDQMRGAPSAGEHFEKARLAEPTALLLVQRGVASRMAGGNRAEAVKLYRDLAAARPDDLAIQLGYADFLEQQADGDSLALQLAHEALESVLKISPGDPRIIRRLFQLAQASGNKSRQITLIEQLSTNDPESVLLYASLSRKLFPADDSAAREKLDQRFIQSIDAHPAVPELARAASDHFNDTQRPDQAIAILKKHVEAAPSSLDLRTRLGILHLAAKQDAEGERALNDVLAIYPRQPLAHQALAKFHRLNGNADLARTHAGELLKIRGGSQADFIKLADEWLAAGNPRQARLLLERAIYEHPGDYELACKLAIAARRDPETSALASRLFREAEAARPADVKPAPTFLIESSEALLGQGQTKAAEESLRTAIRALPPEAKKETAAALRRLAQLWESENRNGDAARALRQRAEALDR